MEYRARVQRGEGGGVRAARVSMWARMAAITRGSVMTASMRNAAPQRGHWLMSLSNTRRRRCIQVISARVRADAGSPTRTRSPFRDPVHRPRTKPPSHLAHRTPGSPSLPPRTRTFQPLQPPTATAKCRHPTHRTGSNQTPRYFAGYPHQWAISPILAAALIQFNDIRRRPDIPPACSRSRRPPASTSSTPTTEPAGPVGGPRFREHFWTQKK